MSTPLALPAMSLTFNVELMNTNNRNVSCNECFGLGSKEFLIVLEIPELDDNGKLILYARKTTPCAACRKIKTSRLARPESPALREAVEY